MDTGELGGLAGQLAEVYSKLEEARKENATLSNENSKLAEENTRLRQAGTDNIALKDKNAELSARVDKLESELKDERSSVVGIKNVALENELLESLNANIALDLELETSKKLAVELAGKLSDEQAQARELAERIAGLQSENESLASLDTENKRLRSTSENLDAALRLSEAQLKTAKAEQANELATIATLRTAMNSFEMALETEKEKTRKLVVDLDVVRSELEKTSGLKDQQSKEIETLKERNKEVQARLDAKTDEAKRFAAERWERESFLEQSVRTSDKLRKEDVAKLTSRLETLEKSNASKTSLLEGQQRELSSVRAQLNAALRENDDLRNKIQTADPGAAGRLKTDNETLLADNKRIQKENTRLTQDNSGLDMALASANDALERTKAENAKLKETLEKQKVEPPSTEEESEGETSESGEDEPPEFTTRTKRPSFNQDAWTRIVRRNKELERKVARVEKELHKQETPAELVELKRKLDKRTRDFIARTEEYTDAQEKNAALVAENTKLRSELLAARKQPTNGVSSRVFRN